MNVSAILFWCVVALSCLWCGWFFVASGIGETYHSMAVRGDLLYSLRRSAIAVPVVTAVVVLGLWLRKRRLPPHIYARGVMIAAVGALMPIALPKIDSGYRQVYWLNAVKYEIPWQYGPFNGSPTQGGRVFLVKVSVAGLVPEYETLGKTITIGKAVAFNYGKGGSGPAQFCVKQFSELECQWRRGGSVYLASGEANLFPRDTAGWLNDVSDLLDSFAVAGR